MPPRIKKWPTQKIYAKPLIAPHLATRLNAGVVLLANVIAHQSETFSEAEDATDKLGVIVCRMAHALMRHEANQ